MSKLITTGSAFVNKVTTLPTGKLAFELSLVSRSTRNEDGFDNLYLPVTAYAPADFVIPDDWQKKPFDVVIEGLFYEKNETDKGVFFNLKGFMKSLSLQAKKS